MTMISYGVPNCKDCFFSQYRRWIGSVRQGSFAPIPLFFTELSPRPSNFFVQFSAECAIMLSFHGHGMLLRQS